MVKMAGGYQRRPEKNGIEEVNFSPGPSDVEARCGPVLGSTRAVAPRMMYCQHFSNWRKSEVVWIDPYRQIGEDFFINVW